VPGGEGYEVKELCNLLLEGTLTGFYLFRNKGYYFKYDEGVQITV